MELIIPKPEITVKLDGCDILLDPIEAEWMITDAIKSHQDVEDPIDREKAVTTEVQKWLDTLPGSELKRGWSRGETVAFMIQLPDAIEEYKKKLRLSQNSSTPTDTESSLTPLQSPLDAFNSHGSSETKSPPLEKHENETSSPISPQSA